MNNIQAIIVFRGEGPNVDPIWPAGQWCSFETADALDLKLAQVAATIDHAGYDKFDIEVVLADGSRVEALWLLGRGERPAGVVWQVLDMTR